MASILQIVDPDDPTTLRVDLNFLAQNEAAPSGFLLVDDGFDLGSIDTDVEILEQAPYPGGQVISSHAPPVEMTITLLARHTNLEDLLAEVRTLHTELAQGGLIRWVPEGGQVRYIEFFPSEIPALLRDEPDNYLHVVGQFMDPGFQVSFLRHPYLRGPLGEPQVLSLSNDASGRDLSVINPGNVPSPCRVTIQPGGPTPEVVEARIGRRSRGTLTEFTQVYAFEVEAADVARDNNTTVTTDDGRGVAVTNFGPIPWMRRRWRKTIQVATPRTLAGAYRVLASVKPGAGLYHLQVRWADGNREPAEVSNAKVEFDGTDLNGLAYVEVDLGIVRPRENLVTLEGWAQWEEGATQLFWDQVTLVPVDELYVVASTPGHRGGGSSVTHYHGRELDNLAGASVTKEDDRKLNNVGDECATPGGYQVLPAGRHTFEAKVTIRNKNEGKATIGVLEVRDANNLVIDSVKLSGRKNKLLSKREKSVTIDATGLMGYRAVIRMTNEPTDSDAYVLVHRLSHRFQRFAGAADKLVLDGTKRNAYLEASDTRQSSRLQTTGFLELAPGGNVLIMALSDIAGSGYADVVDREPLGRHRPGRTATVTIQVEPRYSA